MVMHQLQRADRAVQLWGRGQRMCYTEKAHGCVMGALSDVNGIAKPRCLDRQNELILNMRRHRLDTTEVT